jgi:hypothetical protein
LAVLLLSGCTTVRSYDSELNQTLAIAGEGQVDAALAQLDANNKKARKDLLYYLERGELLRLKGDYRDSQAAWGSADARVQKWEATAAADPNKLLATAGSYVLNDKVRPYEGHDYEKVMLTTRMAMNFLARGDLADARVAIKQTHEREALIAELRAREYQRVQEETEKRGSVASFKDLNGYPVQTIDNPEVNALKNSYQSALSHYLAGFIYEALGEPSLAAAGYRQAIELKPGTPQLEEALGGLDERVAARDDAMTDTLIVIEAGFAPARRSRQFSLPIPVDDHLVLISTGFPVIEGGGDAYVPAEIRADGAPPLVPVQITSVDAMARRALRDDMPGIVLRNVIRSTTKAVAQYQAQRAAEERRRSNDDAAGTLFDLAALALMMGTVATESADERGWRSLPAQVYIARGKLPRGKQVLSLPTPEGPRSVDVDISGRHAFIVLRFLRGYLFAMLPEVPLPGGRGAAASAAHRIASIQGKEMVK